MSNIIQALHYNENEIRMTEIEGEPWWVAKDICDVLEIKNPSDAIKTLDDDEKNTLCLTEGIRAGNPNVNVVNEAGLYQLIFKSVKPEAKAFKRWVTHEVLPAIRRDGIFMVSGVVAPEVAEIAALEYRIAAAKKRLEARELECRAKLVQRIEGAIPIIDWIDQHYPALNTKQRCNLSRSIKRCISGQLKHPVGLARRKGGGKVASASEADINAAIELLKPIRKELN